VDLRPATDEEREHLFALIRADAGAYLGEGMDLIGFTWEQLHAALLTDGWTAVGTVDGDVVVLLWLEVRQRVLHVHALTVEPAWRGLGMGPVALRAVARQKRSEVDVVELGVHDDNQAAWRLYHRLGFEVVRSFAHGSFEVLRCPVDRLAGEVPAVLGQRSS